MVWLGIRFPALLVVVALFVYPVASSIWYSFTNKKSDPARLRFLLALQIIWLAARPFFFAAFMGARILWTAASLAARTFDRFPPRWP